jgi:hypothetical protein
MATQVQSLFGITPEALQLQRNQQLQEQALAFAQLKPAQRATMMMYQGGAQLGNAAAGLMGAQDPELARAAALQKLAKESDFSTPEGLIAFAQKVKDYSPDAALQASQKAQELRLHTAQADKAVLANTQEAKLREELTKLGPNATEDQIRDVVMKYGSADKTLTALQQSADKAAARIAAAESQKERLAAQREMLEARLEMQRQIAEMQGATQRQIAQMQIEGRQQLAAITAALKSSGKEDKLSVLKPQLQKEEGEDLKIIDDNDAQIKALEPSIQALTADPKTGKRMLELGPLANGTNLARNWAGSSTEQSRAYENLKAAVGQAVNIQVSAEKGVQTDGDVLRFAKALIGAYGANDSEATLQALKRFKEATETAKKKRMARVDQRRTAQNVEPYFGGSKAPTQGKGTADDPIVLK